LIWCDQDLIMLVRSFCLQDNYSG